MHVSLMSDVAKLVHDHELRYDVSTMCSLPELMAKQFLSSGRNLIVIDTFRNVSSITVALAAGALDVMLFGKGRENLEMLKAEAASYSGLKLLAGEFEGQPIPGFDCGNSPLDFSVERVSGRRIYYSSTNGGAAVQSALSLTKKELVLGCILNGAAIGRAIASGHLPLPLMIVCAGFRGGFAIEDCLTAGQILLVARSHGADLGILDDCSCAAMELAKARFGETGNVLEPRKLAYELAQSRCGSVLTTLGLGADIAAAIDGTGLDPAIVIGANDCIPIIDRRSSPPRIIAAPSFGSFSSNPRKPR
ncbi:putative 2-phosphosulfolactate phosphatase [Anatilimnocola aggregata]|uniref:Probable 2-phosphosulfolactate phosphatase n=1 Tax=Anatilimnocola aggregata TaxID=2528021 RepID=A0A517YGY1_9BACT|nr:2-phosphosulfolactate phosphatase [Anatilimnocola aggregata]QDU29487.1 putative 2-phosphosulfolactate phosphatase [Anatilimnocola aggregata]